MLIISCEVNVVKFKLHILMSLIALEYILEEKKPRNSH